MRNEINSVIYYIIKRLSRAGDLCSIGTATLAWGSMVAQGLRSGATQLLHADPWWRKGCGVERRRVWHSAALW